MRCSLYWYMDGNQWRCEIHSAQVRHMMLCELNAALWMAVHASQAQIWWAYDSICFTEASLRASVHLHNSAYFAHRFSSSNAQSQVNNSYVGFVCIFEICINKSLLDDGFILIRRYTIRKKMMRDGWVRMERVERMRTEHRAKPIR